MAHRVSDDDRKKQAIANAFRVACLSIHGKPLLHTAIHYHDCMHLPATVDDPKVYYDTLETARIRHNGANGISATQHKPHQKSLEDFYRYIQAHYPHMSPSQAREEGDRQAYIFQYEIEDKLHREKPDKPLDENEVFKILDRKLKNFIKPHKEAALPKLLDNPNAYYPFAQHSAYGMAQASKNIDNLLQWANEDVGKGGKGHHFRERILDKGIKHLGPREAGLAWYLLSPNRSELAYIDNTILDALGYKPKDYTPRDHAKFERELMAGRDASGYHHTPLGQFQKGLLDVYHGPTSFESLAVHDPVRVKHVNWQPQPAPHTWPDWWEDTKPYRDDVAKEWNANVGKYNPPQTVMARLEAADGAGAQLRVRVGDENFIYYWAEIPASCHVAALAGASVRLSVVDDNWSRRPRFRISLLDDVWHQLGESQSWIDFSLPESEDLIRKMTYTRLQIDPKLATVGPNLDESVVDPLASNVSEGTPSWEFLTDGRWPGEEKDQCERCHGTELIEINGRLTACPDCTSWQPHNVFDDGQSNPLDNPEPGQLNPSPTLSSP